jgi:hypothetical protein
VKGEVKIRELALERDVLKVKVSFLQKENAGLVQASENMRFLVGALKDEVETKKLLLAACKDARDYIGVCDEPALTRMLQEAIDVAEGEKPVKKDEVGDGAEQGETVTSADDDGQGETEAIATDEQVDGGDPVAG